MKGTAFPGGATKGQHRFSQIPSVDTPRSQFDRSCGLKTTFYPADLVPIFVDEALPGDTINLRTASFCRMSTPFYPVMDNMFMDFFFFAVPIRLVWDNWAKFNGEQVDPGDSTDFLVPTMTEQCEEYSLSDLMGIPLEIPGLEFNSLHHRAYNLIWNEWFRDENLQDSVVVDRDDGPDNPLNYSLLKRGKRHDYFTSCLPWPQKGQAVPLPLGATAPVVSTDTDFLWNIGNAVDSKLIGDPADEKVVVEDGMTSSAVEAQWGSESGLEVDLSSATASSINELREAFQMQKMMERDARGGSRYTEILRSHFGVVSPDQRLQRPEYLGGGTSRINVNPVAATSRFDGQAIGKLGGFATQAVEGVGFVKSFVEHCLIIGLVNVRADITYQQGLERMFSRQTRYDFYWPALAHLGEQVVKNKEIFAQGSDAPVVDEEAFGYQERFAEYRYKSSRTTGGMRSTSGAPLDPWHLGLEFENLPVLNEVFIEDQPPIARVLSGGEGVYPFIGDFYFSFKHARPMPTFSVPGLIDHF